MRSPWLLFLVGLATVSISEKLFVSSQSPTDDLYLEGQASGDLEDAEDGGLPIDDEDGEDGSGSGSGDFALPDGMDQEESLSKTSVSKEMSPPNPPTTATGSQHPLTTSGIEKVPVPDVDSREEEGGRISPTADWFPQSTSDMPPGDADTTPVDASVNKETDEDNSLDRWDNPTPKNSEEDVQLTDVENEIVALDGRGSRIYELGSPGEVTSENVWERTEVLAAVIACGVVGFICAVLLLLLLAYRMKKKDEGSYDLGDTKLSTTQYHKAPTKEFYA